MSANVCPDCHDPIDACWCLTQRASLKFEQRCAGRALFVTLEPMAASLRSFKSSIAEQWDAKDEAFLRALKISPR